MRSSSKTGARSFKLAFPSFFHALAACYAAAALCPEMGKWLNSLEVFPAEIVGPRQVSRIILAASVLLSGVVVGGRWKGISLRSLMIDGLVVCAAKIVFAVVTLATLGAGLAYLPTYWRTATFHIHEIVYGLALVFAMPTAVSATAWAAKSGADAAKALAITIVSTLLAPVTSVIVFWIARQAISADESFSLTGLAPRQATSVLLFCVIVPGALGIVWGRSFPHARVSLSSLKAANSLVLLLLNYINASVTFAAIFRPDAIVPPKTESQIMASSALAAILSAGSLAALLLYSRGVCRIYTSSRMGRFELLPLRYSIGMYNTGLALVMASMVSDVHPWIGLTPILFTLLQHICAAWLHTSTTPSQRSQP